MKKMLIALFIVFILGFGIVGYTQATADTNKIINEDHLETIESSYIGRSLGV
ncbi:hypothetical protein JOC34_003167 [Virgibacillus halotolerans]|uniref:hypothetical protein n=1 Tax=Virgibacillus halotolerans TaxID=1071053 RepID=UPI001961D1C9|nr:hypothetical protein [Virgibacillus halotolerans]MBM7600753.1 hypothetical protein [Virgibacillus halotolerans]